MKPSEVSNTLRHIASTIDNSQKPSKELVAKDLKKIIAVVNEEQDSDIDYSKSSTEEYLKNLDDLLKAYGVNALTDEAKQELMKAINHQYN